jgi:hypothetical protein
MGAEILGPASCLDSAEEHVEYADAAVLDIDLNGRNVFPVADRLLERGVPFVFYSGCDIVLPTRFLHTCLLPKPVDRALVLDNLFDVECESSKPIAPREDNVLACLPRLRLAARLLMDDSSAADRLVELTLKHALAQIDDRPRHVSLDAWLIQLLDHVHHGKGRDLYN